MANDLEELKALQGQLAELQGLLNQPSMADSVAGAAKDLRMQDVVERTGRAAGVAGQRFAEATGINPAALVNPGIPAINNQAALSRAAQNTRATGKKLVRGAVEGAKAFPIEGEVPEDAKLAGALGTAAGAGLTMVQPGVVPAKGGMIDDMARAVDDSIGTSRGAVGNLVRNPGQLFTAPRKGIVKAAYKAAGDAGEQAFEDLSTVPAQNLMEGAKSASFTKKMARLLDEPGALVSKESVPEVIRFRKGLFSDIQALKQAIQRKDISGGKPISALTDELVRKQEVYRRVTGLLENLAPKIREADKLAAQRAAVAPFRTFSKKGLVGLGASATGAALKATRPSVAMLNALSNLYSRRKKD